jgi:hypothetical protein
VLIVVGAVEAFFLGLWTMFVSPDGHHERDVWLRLGPLPPDLIRGSPRRS